MIEAKGLTMRYGATLALDDATFDVGQGEIIGFLGPNGAGKTTAMKILATHLIPISGTASIGGHDIHEEPLEIRKLLGYLPEEPPLYKNMEVEEYLRFVGSARDLSGERLRSRIDWVVEACELKKVYRKLCGELSRGYKQRVGLAQALLHDPKALILDEPTTGLDPLQIIEIRKLIKDLAKEKTIIFSTHIMQEASSVTERILIIHNGRIIADDRIDDLLAGFGERRIRVCLKAAESEAEKLLGDVEGASGVERCGEYKGYAVFNVSSSGGTDLTLGLAEKLGEAGVAAIEVSEDRYTLEEAFIRLVKQNTRDALASGEVQ